ncbi:MAG TPA: efflux RND transporter permease subunit [Steroidobacteraceae bacterium]|nr:efflux RND transporter permease subunit [Steroidobacteraceae bacterium]
MSPSAPFIVRPVATALLMVAIFLAGGVAYFQLPVSALPEVDYPTMQVLTFYPGASPSVVAATVTAPLERQFGEVAGLSQMTSTSAGGVSVIVLEFQLSLNIDVAEQEVQAAINAAQSYLPADLPTPPVYSKSNPADAPVLTLALTSDEIPLSQVEDLADTRLSPKLSQISGVGLVSISGGQKPAVRIQANPTALAAYGINLEDLRSALTGNSLDSAKGNFDGPAQDYTINANDQLTSGADYKNVVVAYRGGAPVMLGAVARVVNGVENSKLAAWQDYTPAVLINIQRQPGANTIQVVNSIEKLLPQLEQTLPRAVHTQIVTDRTLSIRASVRDVEFELLLAVALVVLVIFVFLRSVRATVIPSVAVPLSLIGTLGVMYLLDYSLNNLAMMALTISTGFVVDDAIVMIENISRYIESGDRPLEAALKGAEQIGFTILSLTVSLIAVLIPLLFMGDIAGRLFRQFAITLATTIMLSAFVSLTLTPMMSARLLRRTPEEQQGHFYRVTERMFRSIIDFYGRTLQRVLAHERLTLLVAAGTLLLTGLLYDTIPKGFFPTQDTGIIQGITQAAGNISFSAMARAQQALARVLLADPAVQNISSFIGADGTNTTLNSGRIQIVLKPLNQRHLSATQVIARLGPQLAQVPDIKLYMQPVQDLTVDDRVSRTQFQYTLEDPNADELNATVAQLLPQLRRLPQLSEVVTDQQLDGVATSLIIDRATASRFGITPQTIDNTLYDAFGQRQINTMYTQLNQYHVILEADPRFQASPANLRDIYIQASSGSSSSATPNTGGSSSGAGAGGAASPGNALLSPTTASATAATPAASSALTAGSAGTTVPASLNATSALSAGQNAATGASVLSGASTPGNSLGSVQSSGGGASGSSATSLPQQTPVPLSAFTHVHTQSETLAVNRQGQFPAVTISFNLAGDYSLGQAITAIKKVVARAHLPASVIQNFQGTASAFEGSQSNEGLLILAALVTVYIVLGVLYESFIHPVTILSTLPSAGVGALLALRLFGLDLDIVGIIGIILLIGIVQKNGIMMVDFALEAERKEGKSASEAVREAARLRFRPIVMTTMAALLSGLPLAFGSGMGSELRRPLGVAIVGGLLISQVLTLYTTPVIYIFFDRVAERFGRRPGTDHVPEPDAGPA